MFVTMAIHHPKPEHVDDFVAFMKRIEAGMEGTPGLHSLESYRDVGGDRLVAIGRWESPQAAAEGIPRVLAIGGRPREWSAAPDEVLQLVSA